MGKKLKAVAGEIVTASGPWREVLLVCRKCGAKGKRGGFGPDGRDTLPDALKQTLRELKRRREVRVLEVGCLGVCPKGAVTVMRGGAPGEMLLVPRGMDLAALVGGAGEPPRSTPIREKIPTDGF